jgi:hypothetical protein
MLPYREQEKNPEFYKNSQRGKKAKNPPGYAIIERKGKRNYETYFGISNGNLGGFGIIDSIDRLLF